MRLKWKRTMFIHTNQPSITSFYLRKIPIFCRISDESALIRNFLGAWGGKPDLFLRLFRISAIIFALVFDWSLKFWVWSWILRWFKSAWNFAVLNKSCTLKLLENKTRSRPKLTPRLRESPEKYNLGVSFFFQRQEFFSLPRSHICIKSSVHKSLEKLNSKENVKKVTLDIYSQLCLYPESFPEKLIRISKFETRKHQKMYLEFCI